MNSNYIFYFGLDGNTTKMDYVTIMIHEITHGLGFGCYCHPDGTFFYDSPGIYDCMLYQGLNDLCFTELSEYERAALMVSNNLYSGRPNSNLLKANNGVRVKMYAPNQYSWGSTAHHWDSGVEFVNFMEYAYQYPLHTFNNRKTGILTDMGWKVPEIDSNAVWVTFYANGGKGTRNPQPLSPEVEQNLKINSYSKEGYAFSNWNTELDGTGISFQNRESITITEDIDLYAQWDPGTFTLTFYAPNGTVFPKSKEVVYNSSIGELPIPLSSRPDYKFLGWNLFNAFLTEETIWNYASDNTAIAKWSIFNDIEDYQNTESVFIFPNPTTGEFRVTSDELQVTSVEIFDVMGISVGTYRIRPETPEITINISNLNAGIYFVKIQTEKGLVTKKIIKN
jgi:hypothetical protein